MAQDPVSPVDPWSDLSAPVQEDMGFQRMFWRIQRAGWALMALILLLALLGAFSEGPLSRTRAQGGGLEIAYERVYRNAAASPLTIEFTAAGAAREIVISHSLLQKMDFETVMPPPERAETRPDGLHLRFAGEDSATVYLTVRPAGLGPLQGEIALAGGGEPALIRSFILP